MEQFLLSPDIAIKQTSRVQAVTTNTTDNTEEDFDPILQEAVNSRNDVTNTKQETRSSANDESDKNVENLASPDNSDPAQQAQAASQIATAQENSQNTLPASSTQNNTTSSLPFTSTIDPNAEIALSLAPSQADDNTNAETILLKQLQQIIDEEKNIGAITIKGSIVSESTGLEQGKNLQGLSSMVLDDTGQEAIQARETNAILPDEQKTSGPKNVTSNAENNRQELTEQFLNAKFSEAKNDGEQQSGSQNDKQKGSDSQHKSNGMGAAIASTPVVGETDMSEMGFTQQLRSTDIPTNTNNTSIEGKFAPGAHQPAIPERELVDNLIQRFSVNPRLQTSKLTMQLHPAELGQLKIDILVKGDSISANIVAHSQQVIETMEKNIHRLRAVLEDQGFTVDSFQVVMDDNGGKQSELFQEQFNSKQQEFSFTKSSANDSEVFDNILDLQGGNLDTTPDDSGVNVTI